MPDTTTYGTSGDDILSGGNGKDTIYGGDGNDTISGGNNNDSILGGGIAWVPGSKTSGMAPRSVVAMSVTAGLVSARPPYQA